MKNEIAPRRGGRRSLICAAINGTGGDLVTSFPVILVYPEWSGLCFTSHFRSSDSAGRHSTALRRRQGENHNFRSAARACPPWSTTVKFRHGFLCRSLVSLSFHPSHAPVHVIENELPPRLVNLAVFPLASFLPLRLVVLYHRFIVRDSSLPSTVLPVTAVACNSQPTATCLELSSFRSRNAAFRQYRRWCICVLIYFINICIFLIHIIHVLFLYNIYHYL